MARGQPTEANDLPRIAGSIDWAAASAQLRTAEAGDTADDLIDALTEAVFAGEVGGEAVPCLIDALDRARSELSLRSAALALAAVAQDDPGAVDALVAASGRVAQHPFLAPALLEALGLLALQSPLALAELSALLLRLCPADSRYLLVKGAQVIGLLDGVRPDPGLRVKLDELATAADLAVQAEARQQLALAALADALLADCRGALQERLAGARAAFARAELSEEHRPDAAMFVRLLDLLLAFPQLQAGGERAAGHVAELASSLDHALTSLAPHDWHGYRSERATRQAQRVLHIADALRRAAAAASVAEDWTNLAAALEELAWLYAEIRAEPPSAPSEKRVTAALACVADKVFAASLGPLLARVVQQRRLARITADYVLAHGEDEVAAGLRALEQAAATFAFIGDPSLPDSAMGEIARQADRVGQRPDVLLRGFVQAIQEDRVARWVEEVGLTPVSLPVEGPELYGNDPVVDDIVRPLLHETRQLLGEYPLPKWARLKNVLVSLVEFTHYVRDRTPAYVVCEEDGGLGQRASEGDLQDHLFEWLRQPFGRSAVYEFARTGGGRPDTGVLFPEARFPIEAKHEFASIEPAHVRASFVAQSDVYATAADRASFLMVLDLRANNAAGGRKRAAAARGTGDGHIPVALYHLRDSFRVESLPTDPDIPDATSKVVIVGLVPGNRPLPSSMSTYSKRPASARRKRGASPSSG
jgi:hypothetical protein